MNRIIAHWYELAVYIAAGVAMVLALGEWSFEQRILLLSLCVLHVHFFEEFGFPGGFVWGGLKVEQGRVNPDVGKWPLNMLSAWWGNEWFALLSTPYHYSYPNITGSSWQRSSSPLRRC